ncbi:MAG: hypothetical protein JWP71_3058 [Mucilaginibacter sp.]|nr:hypothetical protein [Mucilaginibacter sp.]
MKIVKTLLFAIMAICFLGSAQAQIRVKARIGTPPPPQHRVVVVQRPVHHYQARRHYVKRRHVVVRRHY